MGHEDNPLVALERGCLTTTPLGACATARPEKQRRGAGAFFRVDEPPYPIHMDSGGGPPAHLRSAPAVEGDVASWRCWQGQACKASSTVVGLRGQIAHRIGVQLGGGPRQWPVESAEAGKPDCRAVGWAALWLRPTCVECVAVAPAGESAHAGGL